MRSLTPYAVLGGIALLGTACGFFGPVQLTTTAGPSSGHGGDTTVGTGGGGGIDTNIGGAANPGPFSYEALCGEGCQPGEDCTPGTGGAGGAYPSTTPMACQLVLDEGARNVSNQCEAVGETPAGEPCLDSSQCAPGLGCVASGVCRAYCCGDLEACAPKTFCAPRPMAQNDLPLGTDVAPLVPVCAPVEDCQLLDDSTCTDGETCTVVRADGTVSCVKPGTGEEGDNCPCAAGYACAPKINACFKLCHLDRPDDCGSGSTCQGGVTSYPTGFGVCVAN